MLRPLSREGRKSVKTVTIVGPRPQFIQAAPVWRALSKRGRIEKYWFTLGTISMSS
jgi:UDP-N-acetylglucosamine 2-epimerase